ETSWSTSGAWTFGVLLKRLRYVDEDWIWGQNATSASATNTTTARPTRRERALRSRQSAAAIAVARIGPRVFVAYKPGTPTTSITIASLRSVAGPSQERTASARTIPTPMKAPV